MKIFIMFFSLLIGLSAFAQSPSYSSSVMEPQWGEFCPPMYENAIFKTSSSNSAMYKENNYWALRKVKFQKAIMECKMISKSQTELNTCFARVANIEKNKTNQRKEARYEKHEDLDRQIKESGTVNWY